MLITKRVDGGACNRKKEMRIGETELIPIEAQKNKTLVPQHTNQRGHLANGAKRKDKACGKAGLILV